MTFVLWCDSLYLYNLDLQNNKGDKMTISELSWNKVSFLAKLHLYFKSTNNFKIRMQSANVHEQAEACSALSSCYYSIVGTGIAHFKNIFRDDWKFFLFPVLTVIWFLTWFPLVLGCYLSLLHFSNQVVKLIGYDTMTVDQLDIRQSILRLTMRYKEAKSCIHLALEKKPEKPHTRGLLHVGLAEILIKDGDKFSAKFELAHAVTEAKASERDDPRQAVRIYRHCARLYFKLKDGFIVDGELCLHKARAIARRIEAIDQIVKM